MIMSELGFYLIFTKPNKHKIETKTITDTAKNLDDAKNKIIYQHFIDNNYKYFQNLKDFLNYYIDNNYTNIN